MSVRFQELDWRRTPMGEITLRRRREPITGADIFEVKLGDEFLMSSLFTVAEVQLAVLGLSGFSAAQGEGLDVVVGGLGLGYTADAALQDPRVVSLRVVEALGEVIEWHERGLLPLSAALTGDPRCQLVKGDFFALVAQGAGFGQGAALSHAILLDVDHTPSHVLHPSHAAFYTVDGLRRLAALLHAGGVFALWSDAPPDAAFVGVLEEVFASVVAHVVTFANPLTGGESSNSVYVAR